MNALVDLVTYIVLIVLLCGLLLWVIDQVPRRGISCCRR